MLVPLVGLYLAATIGIVQKDFKRVLAAEARARGEGREPTFAELVGTGGG